MNMHVSVPGTPQDSRAFNLATQERERRETLQRLSRLRREARDQIEELIRFLDSTDTYASTELEVNEDDAPQHQDDDEPSMCGLSAHDIERQHNADYWSIDREAEHDGREVECEDEGAQCDDEGITDTGIGDIDGVMEQCGNRAGYPYTGGVL